MSKKLLNSVGSAVDECLVGLVAAHPGLELLQGHSRVVIRRDIATVVAHNKVTLLSGGGSGHEPAHGGYVGQAMLSAAVAGDVFASPPPGTILAAIRAIASPAGTLMIVKNYTGDRLNFGIAAERARSEGISVRMIVVGEDTALPDTGGCAGRRGLCGTVLVHKVTGAMAELGHSLEEIAATAQRLANSIATMSVCLSPCTVPGLGSSFILGENEIEMGLGIHGEAGAHRCQLESADRVVAQMLSHLTSQEPGHQYFTTTPGTEVCLVVNNLGGTSNLEMGVVVNASIKHITECLQLKVVRVISGTLMTSLDMAGVSLTLMNLDTNAWLRYLDMPTTAPGWPYVSTTPPPTCSSGLLPSALQRVSPSSVDAVTTSAGLALQQCVSSVCLALSNSTNELNQLDRGCGDGDCGTTITNGVNAIQQRSATIPWDNAKESLLVMANCVETSMGGTSGAIYTLFLTAGAAVIGHTPSPADWVRAMEAGMNAIMRYGGASVGDRTMLDALHPAVSILCGGLLSGDTTNLLQCLKKAVAAAEQGATGTAGMLARAGRASNVHASQLSNPDPGARAVVVWLSAILKCVDNNMLL